MDNSKENNIKYISLIPPDGGFGNQIIGIRECLIIAKFLNRTCLIPPLREHYLKSNTTFYRFSDVFKLDIDNIIIDDNYNLFNKLDCKKRYCMNPFFVNRRLRHEHIIQSKTNTDILLNIRKIHNENSLQELKKIEDNFIIIKWLFNNLAISKCTINGCFTCDFNDKFKGIYGDICSKWDFSDNIKSIGDLYIKNTFTDNQKFICIHIRLPDVMRKTLIQYTGGKFNYKKILKIINGVKEENKLPVFICSNNVPWLKKRGINENFNTFSNHTFNSFIEQYICCQGEKFYYLNVENTRFNSQHNRSTWTSFVNDYRIFFNKKNNNINLIDYVR